jgi:hypothetical protein
MFEVAVAAYALISAIIAVGVYRKSPPVGPFQRLMAAWSIGVLWPLMIVVLLVSEDRDI